MAQSSGGDKKFLISKNINFLRFYINNSGMIICRNCFVIKSIYLFDKVYSYFQTLFSTNMEINSVANPVPRATNTLYPVIPLARYPITQANATVNA